MNILLFIEYAEQYEEKRDKIIKLLNLAKSSNSKLFIITQQQHGFIYVNDKEIIHIFYNTEKYFLDYISKIIFFKNTNKKLYIKFKRFIVHYISYIFISKKYKINYLFYLHIRINLQKSFSFEILNKFYQNEYFFGYLDRSIINYLDDPDIHLINLKHPNFIDFEKYIFRILDNGLFIKNLEFTTEYFATKVRYYFENKFNVQNLNLIPISRKDLTKINLNTLEFSSLSQYLGKSQKSIQNYNYIRNNKFNSFKKNNIDINYIYKNLELEGLFNVNETILNLSEQPNYINETFPYIKMDYMNFKNFINNKDELDNDKIFIDIFFYNHDKLKEIIIKLKEYEKKIIIRKNLFLKDKNTYNENKSKIESLLNSFFKKIKIIKNIRSDIYIIE